MRLLGLVVTLAVIGFAINSYLGSSSTAMKTAEGTRSTPGEYLDQANQSAAALDQALEQRKHRLDGAN